MPRYIVNPGNAVHSVEESEFKRLTLLPGYREATTDEIAGWYAMQGLSVPPDLQPDRQPLTDSQATATDVDDASNNKNSSKLPDLPTGNAPKQPRKNRRANGV